MAFTPQIITFDWQDETLQLKPTHDLYMQIEERVSFNRLANAFASSVNGTADVPMSHVSWVIFCVLRHCGKAVASPMDVHQAIFDGAIKWGLVLADLIAGYYGPVPAKAPAQKKAVASRRNSRR